MSALAAVESLLGNFAAVYEGIAHKQYGEEEVRLEDTYNELNQALIDKLTNLKGIGKKTVFSQIYQVSRLCYAARKLTRFVVNLSLRAAKDSKATLLYLDPFKQQNEFALVKERAEFLLKSDQTMFLYKRQTKPLMVKFLLDMIVKDKELKELTEAWTDVWENASFGCSPESMKLLKGIIEARGVESISA